MKILLAVMSLFSVFGVAKSAAYSEGQLWAYKTRPGEERSRVLINKIEVHEKLGKIFHISVDGVKVKNPKTAGGFSSKLPHFPVSEETLRKSLTKLMGKRKANPAYLDGYKAWKSAFDADQAGIFTISVAEIVGLVEQTINQP